MTAFNNNKLKLNSIHILMVAKKLYSFGLINILILITCIVLEKSNEIFTACYDVQASGLTFPDIIFPNLNSVPFLRLFAYIKKLLSSILFP